MTARLRRRRIRSGAASGRIDEQDEQEHREHDSGQARLRNEHRHDLRRGQPQGEKDYGSVEIGHGGTRSRHQTLRGQRSTLHDDPHQKQAEHQREH